MNNVPHQKMIVLNSNFESNRTFMSLIANNFRFKVSNSIFSDSVICPKERQAFLFLRIRSDSKYAELYNKIRDFGSCHANVLIFVILEINDEKMLIELEAEFISFLNIRLIQVQNIYSAVEIMSSYLNRHDFKNEMITDNNHVTVAFWNGSALLEKMLNNK
ncbi:hypothetical protein BpHYR1_032537 [Brachionus plicatilis]|uniref:Uncharacterized protein n=1 Tax=Brachionus plicatilis TaxID=10195 RepID=A0A3M7T948_BRAPC|nr:hypothetical protein BpHYR1_032537 [Brachionus plicatilis]